MNESLAARRGARPSPAAHPGGTSGWATRQASQRSARVTHRLTHWIHGTRARRLVRGCGAQPGAGTQGPSIKSTALDVQQERTLARPRIRREVGHFAPQAAPALAVRARARMPILGDPPTRTHTLPAAPRMSGPALLKTGENPAPRRRNRRVARRFLGGRRSGAHCDSNSLVSSSSPRRSAWVPGRYCSSARRSSRCSGSPSCSGPRR